MDPPHTHFHTHVVLKKEILTLQIKRIKKNIKVAVKLAEFWKELQFVFWFLNHSNHLYNDNW